jgi:hypothetical protein
MKKIILACLLLSCITTFAQSSFINYKALIKDGGNAVVTNTQVTVQFRILAGVAQTIVYQETHMPTTDANGIIVINIGEGVVNSGVYGTIDWGSDDHFLNTQINTGAGLTDMGTTGFNAVPYAFSAKRAENISGTTNFVPKSIDGISLGDSSIYDDGSIGIGTTTPSYILDIEGVAPRARITSNSQNFAGLLTQNVSHQYFVGIQGTYEAADGTNSGFHIFDNTAGARRFVVDANGNIGINNSAPVARLDVAGNIKIVDGTQGAGKVLTDVNGDGLASWQAVASVAETQTLADVTALGNTVNDQLKNVTDPTDPQDATTKAYVDILQAQIANLEARVTALEPIPPIAVGDLVAGGVVFYVAPVPTDLDGDGNLDSGLVCALSNSGSPVEWGCGSDLPNVPNVPSLPGGPVGPGAEIGDGMNNTNGMLTDCPFPASALAARTLGPEWFLPSINELYEMYVNRLTLEAAPGFTAFGTDYYYSSTETNADWAWYCTFSSGTKEAFWKFVPYSVRAVKAI